MDTVFSVPIISSLMRRKRTAFSVAVWTYLSFTQTMPGSSFPSKNSREAPPPVEIWVILSPNPSVLTAAAESPPPMIVIASVSARDLATAMVPFASVGFSNTPIGPFQTTVLADFTSFANSSAVFGQISRPISSAGILSASTAVTSISPSIGSGKALATTQSTGSRILTPFSSAFLSMSLQ